MNPADYSSHPARQLLSQVKTQLTSEALADPELRSNDLYASALESMAALAAAVLALFDKTPAQLVSAHGLAQIQGAFQSIANELAAYETDRSPSRILNARGYLDQIVLPHLWAFGPIGEQIELAPLRLAVEQISRNANESVLWLIRQRDTLSARIRELESQVSNSESRLAELTERVSTQKAEAAAAVAVIQQQSAETETARLRKLEALTDEQREQFNKMLADSERQQEVGLKALAESQNRAAKIVQIVGNIGVTGNFQKVAKDEADRADSWRMATLAFFATGVALAITTFFHYWDQQFTLETTLTVLVRLGYALAITAPAYYTARESARHRTNADRARQTELELASLGPFIELMPEDKKVAIREELTKRYFGSQVPEHTAERPVDIAAFKDWVIELIKATRK